MTTVSVRYIADDVDAAVAFYVERLGFDVEMRPAPGFAMLSRGELRLLLNQPGAGGAGQPAGGRTPEPGGWNRFQLEVSDLEREVTEVDALVGQLLAEIGNAHASGEISTSEEALKLAKKILVTHKT